MTQGISAAQSLGLTWGKVTKDEETGRPKISQKVMGVDISEFIDGIKEVKQAEGKIFQDKIDANTKKIAAYTELQKKITNVQTQAIKLSNSISDQSSVNNMFNNKAIKTADTVNGLQVDTTANLGTFSYKVTQLASSDLRSSTMNVVSASTALGLNGTLNIGTVIPGSSAPITIDGTMSLNNIAAAVNSLTTTTGVYAEVVPGSSGTFQLKIKAQSLGTPLVLSDSGGVMAGLGLTMAASSMLCGSLSATDENTALNLAGNLSLTGNVGTDTVAITNTMTIQDIVNAINTKTTTTGVTASMDIIYTGASSKAFQIKLTTTQPTQVGVSDDGNVVTGLGLDIPTTDYNAISAGIDVDGVSYKRSTNTITDIVKGVTFTLKNNDSILYKADVEYDSSGVFTTLDSFITAYNELNEFYAEKTASKVDNKGAQQALEGADLFGDLWVQQFMSKVRQIIKSPVAGVNPDFNVLQQLGLAFYDKITNVGGLDGDLFLADVSKLYNALNNQYSDLRSFFGDAATSSNYLFQVREMPAILDVNGLSGQNITFTYTDTAGVLSAKFTMGGIDYPATIDTTGYVITGAVDTPFEGVTVNAISLLAPNTTQTSTLMMTQGIMSELNNYLDSVVQQPLAPDRSDAGELLKKIDGLTAQNKKSQDRIDRINKMAAFEVRRLEDQFQQVYAAAIQYESIISMIDSFIAANRK